MIPKNLYKGILPAFLSLFFISPKNTYAMHIMEGYLSPSWSILWIILSLPFIIIGFFCHKTEIIRKH